MQCLNGDKIVIGGTYILGDGSKVVVKNMSSPDTNYSRTRRIFFSYVDTTSGDISYIYTMTGYWHGGLREYDFCRKADSKTGRFNITRALKHFTEVEKCLGV